MLKAGPARVYVLGERFRSCCLRATAVPAGTAEARISYGNSVCLSVRLSGPGGIPSPGEIETPGLHHMIA